MTNITKWSIGINVALIILVSFLFSRPEKIVTVTKEVVKEVKVEGKTTIEYRDKIVERVITSVTAGKTIVIHETSTDKGRTNEEKNSKTVTDTTIKTTQETSIASTRAFTAGGYWRISDQTPGVMLGVNVFNLTAFAMGDYSPLSNKVGYGVGVLIRF